MQLQQKLSLGGVEGDEAVDVIVSCVDNREAKLAVHQVSRPALPAGRDGGQLRMAMNKPWLDASIFPDGLSGGCLRCLIVRARVSCLPLLVL